MTTSDRMQMVKPSFIIFLSLMVFCRSGLAQNLADMGLTPVRSPDSIAHLKKEFGSRKKLPPGFEYQALEALSHFPELRQTPVEFRLKASRMTAKTRPTWISAFLPKTSRTYVVTISNQTIPILNPILLGSLPPEAQVGLLGHELSHVSDFSQKSTLRSFRDLANHLSAHWLDKMEYHTDWIAIQHGLGNNLKAWSSFIRDTFHVKYWRGSGHVMDKNNQIERYMNPDTIDRYMKEKQSSDP
jgi:hypothetical protein